MCTSREWKSFMALISQVMVKKAAGPLHISDTFRKMLLESERTANEDPWLADLETVCYVLENACCLRKLWLFLFRRLHTAVHLSCHVHGQAESITLLFLLPQGEGFRENSHGVFIMKGLVKLILVLFPNTRTTSPHRDMHVAIFIYSCVSFHIFKNAADLWFICMIQLLSFFSSCRLSTWHILSPSWQSLCFLCGLSLFVCPCVHVRAPSSMCKRCQSDQGHASLYTYLSHEY